MTFLQVIVVVITLFFMLIFFVELCFYLALKKDPYTDDNFIEEQLKIIEKEIAKEKAERSKRP